LWMKGYAGSFQWYSAWPYTKMSNVLLTVTRPSGRAFLKMIDWTVLVCLPLLMRHPRSVHLSQYAMPARMWRHGIQSILCVHWSPLLTDTHHFTFIHSLFSFPFHFLTRTSSPSQTHVLHSRCNETKALPFKKQCSPDGRSHSGLHPKPFPKRVLSIWERGGRGRIARKQEDRIKRCENKVVKKDGERKRR
jgi:hypothetical protein